MKINYILSDTTKNATTSALLSVVKKAEENRFQDYIVIVPETKSIIIEKELLEISKEHAFANIFVYSFVRLINRLGFVSSEKIVSKQVCVLLLRKIIYDNISQLECYKKIAKTPGFADKIYETITQFKSSNVTPEDLLLSLETKSESLRAKLKDIAFLYAEYEKALGDSLFDDLDKLNLISKFAKSSDVIRNSEIFVVGFDNVTYEMISVLKELATHSKEITFSCVYFNEKREDKHIQNNELYLKLKRVADELKYPYNPIFFKTKKLGDFYAIQNYLFANRSYKVKPQGSVEIFEAISKRQEIDQVANKILLEIASGKRYKDIGLFVCDLETNKKLIEECFDEYNIPYFINDSYDISKHFAIKFFYDALELVKFNLSQEKVLSFISNPIWANDDFSYMFKYFKETGVSYEDVLEYHENKNDSKKAQQKVEKIISRFKAFYLLFKERVCACKKFSDFVELAAFLKDYFNISEKIENISNYEKENGNLIESEIALQVLEKQEKFNVSAMNFMGELEISLDEFLQVYFTGFSSVKLNLSPVSIDCVIIQNNTDGFYAIKDLFIFGAEEGKFPTKIDDSGIILDRELEETISVIKKPVEPTVKEINKRENFKTYEALLEPSEKLFVSYSLNAFDGKSNVPARSVLRLKNLFGEEIISKNYKKVEFVNFENYAKRFALNVNKFLNSEGVVASDLNKQYSEIKNNISKPFERFLNGIDYSENDFTLKNADGLYFFGDKTSVSQLEKYFDCPYLFFATYGLRLKENKDAKLSSLDVGTIIHRVAELFIVKVGELEIGDNDKLDKVVKEILDTAVSESGVNTDRNNAILKIIFGECKKLCSHILFEQKNSSFKHKISEWEFGGENAVEFELDGGKIIKIEGKIDRIDEFGNYVRIIDYKTGKVESDFSSIYYGVKIQLISYVSAVTKYGNKQVAGVFYLPVHSDYATNDKMLKNMYRMEGFLINDVDVACHMDRTLSQDNKESSFVPLKVKTSASGFEFSGRSSKNLTAKEFDNVKDYNELLCKNAIEEILSGYIEPAPFSAAASQGTSRCGYCKLAGFCGLENSRFKYGRVCMNKVDISSFDTNQGEENG